MAATGNGIRAMARLRPAAAGAGGAGCAAGST